MSVSKRLLHLSSAVAIALAAGLAVPSPAVACGGFFCSQGQPVDQAGERILFAADGENVVAHVQIQYTGEAKKFSWVVPTPSQPTLEIGSDALFQVLRSATRPQFILNRSQEGQCGISRGGPFLGGAATPAGSVAPSASPGVSVISQEQVGPYDSVVLQANDPGALKTWLRENEYDIPPTLDPLLDPYVTGKYFFVALKLQKDRAVGDLQPIVLKYKATKPGIPIRLTGVAATPDMDVYVWVLGKNRAIPENYRHAEINEARIDWLNNGQNYRTVVTQAMNEAGGQAFVTDYAGESKSVPMNSFETPTGLNLDTLRALTDPIDFTRVVLRDGPMLLGTRVYSFLGRHVPKPEQFKNVPDQAFFEALGYRGDAQFAEPEVALYKKAVADAQIKANTEGAVKELNDTFFKPNQEIRALFAQYPYLTQLYSTMSPEEMTQDPTFLFNPELPAVSNLHRADGILECSADYTPFDAPVRIVLSNGLTFRVTQRPGPNGQPVTMPAALRIEQLKSSGAPAVIQDNRNVIAQAVSNTGSFGFGANGGPVTSQPTPVSGGFGCAGCSQTTAPPPPVTQGAGEGLTYALVVLGWLGYRRWSRR